MEQRFMPKAHRLCLWMGPVMIATYLIGFVPLADFFPPPNPNWTSAHLTAWIVEHRLGVQLACVLMMLGAALIAPWAAALAIWTRKTESRFPVLYATQLIALGCGVCILMLVNIFWAAAAYRAGETSPEVTQALWDTGWFLFLFSIPPFIVWFVSLALGVLWNPPEHQLYPRWAAYMTLALCLSWITDLAIVFFKTGQWTYTGFAGLWLIFGSFSVWVHVMTYLGLKAVSRQEQMCRQEIAASTDHAPRVTVP
ncbi:hypothetical protein ACIRL2_42385 [Embleya sp. NPDC127516]|uniref:hypothetical protein n=1 Tax=Embleya sp. NPDC127516 TaxID=3363990 RepID=UPI00381D8EA5